MSLACWNMISFLIIVFYYFDEEDWHFFCSTIVDLLFGDCCCEGFRKIEVQLYYWVPAWLFHILAAMAHKVTLRANPNVAEIFVKVILNREDFYQTQFSSSNILRHTSVFIINCLSIKNYYYLLVIYLQIDYYSYQNCL